MIRIVLLMAPICLAGTSALQAAENPIPQWAHHIVTEVDLAYGDHERQTLDTHLQGQRVGEPDYFVADAQARPTLMWIHGGGWLEGDKARDLSRIMPFLQRGWNVYSINYRQGPETAPQAVDDALCAFRYVVQHTEERGHDPRRIVVGGASSGGHLALVVALLNTQGEHPCKAAFPPRAAVNWFGITDIELLDEFLQDTRPQSNYARAWAGSAAAIVEVSDAYSPMYLISDNAPPIVSVHGTEDSVVPFDQGESFHSSLNTPNELVILRGNHGGFSDHQYQQAWDQIFTFLDGH